MVPFIEKKLYCEKGLPAKRSNAQEAALQVVIRSLAQDPYCTNNPTTYNKTVVDGCELLVAAKHSAGFGFSIMYRIANDSLVIELIGLAQ